MELTNFNDATAYQDFPTNVLATYKGGNPVDGDPGFIVLQKDGAVSWQSNLQGAHDAAGITGAIYMAEQVNDYYRGFAREATLNADGTETLGGPVTD